MKKSKLIIAGLILSLAFTGCTKGSSVSNAGNKPEEIASTDSGAELRTEKPMEEPTTGTPTEKPTMGYTEDDYNEEEARKKFAESDIPDSIKNIFLADGVFIDTQTVGGAIGSMFNFYIWSHEESQDILEWNSYVAADLNGDGKKELLYTVLTEGHEGYCTVVFHEHSDGKVYSYILNTDKIQVGEDGAVFVSDRTDCIAGTGTLLRMKFNKAKIIETELARAEEKSGEIKYYIGKQEVDVNKYSEYVEPLRSGTKWQKNMYRLAEMALQRFKEADIPDSIKNIFLSDGEFIDTQTQTEMKLEDYKLYEIIYSHDETDADIYTETYDLENWKSVFEWQSYIAVDYDGDGKKELFYAVNNGTDGGVIFHEHTDGKVYAYGHQSLRVLIGENGDVVGSGGAALTAHILERYRFDTEKIIETIIAYARQQEDGEYKYYAEGREVNLAEFETYFHLLSEGSLNWTEFRITPGSEENQASGN